MRSGQDLIWSPKLPPAATIEFAIFLVSTAIPELLILLSVPFKTLAGAEGFEPPSPVLETGSLTVELTPLFQSRVPSRESRGKPSRLGTRGSRLLHFLVRRVLAATAAEFLELQPLRRRLPVLGRRIIALFAITAL